METNSMRELMYIVVEAFYKKAVYDVLIGYHFEKFRDPIVLEHHLQRLATFWEMQLTGQVTQKVDRPFHLMFTHLQLNLKRGELGRWIILFHQTLDEVLLADDASDMKIIVEEWKKRIEFFETRFKSHPDMFK